MLFGSNRDFNLLVNIQRELVKDIVEQEILYYKFSLEESLANLYGESTQKTYWNPLKLSCMITRGDQIISDDEFGPDLNREASFAFIREDLVDVNLVPEVGDIVMWHEDYYEVDTVKENQLFLGRDKSYNLTEYGDQFGSSVSIIVECHLTRADKVGITKVR
tara:strand:- start:3535 stop:4020 length:486 start_codon:yes stop_codon:yes gene_type:complete